MVQRTSQLHSILKLFLHYIFVLINFKVHLKMRELTQISFELQFVNNFVLAFLCYHLNNFFAVQNLKMALKKANILQHTKSF